MISIQPKHFPFYIALICLFIILKWGYTYLETDDLMFLLSPSTKLVEVFSGAKFTYVPNKGFYNEHLNIIINKSCSGVNLGILCFIMLGFLSVQHSYHGKNILLSWVIMLMVAYIFTIFVNSSRIVISIIVQQINISFIKSPIIHECVGIATNLTFLIIIYVVTEKALIKLKPNAKLTES